MATDTEPNLDVPPPGGCRRVTHRFSTVAAADLIIVLDRGRIVERGTHTELVRARGHYAELYNLQARGYHRDPGKE